MASPVAEAIINAAPTLHPYYPRHLVMDHYVPNTNSMMETLVKMFAVFGTIISGSLLLSRRKRQSTIRGVGNQLTFVWFVMCGFIHLGLEGYFGVYHKTLAGMNTPLAQVWKEYSISDSRYLTSDSFVLIMERITAFAWGPLAFYVAYAQYHNLPSRYIIQLIISLGQIYGNVLYYCTTLIEGAPHGDPHPYYYYFYFVHFNAWWIVVPGILLFNAIKNLHRAVAASSAPASCPVSKKHK
ncbi:hypothetical protein DFQ26_004944 [Actinomortierella ambigua]|nr:hypothetical protein DFQ26_004944 [Actinomortierella ambigua]